MADSLRFRDSFAPSLYSCGLCLKSEPAVSDLTRALERIGQGEAQAAEE